MADISQDAPRELRSGRKSSLRSAEAKQSDVIVPKGRKRRAPESAAASAVAEAVALIREDGGKDEVMGEEGEEKEEATETVVPLPKKQPIRKARPKKKRKTVSFSTQITPLSQYERESLDIQRASLLLQEEALAYQKEANALQRESNLAQRIEHGAAFPLAQLPLQPATLRAILFRSSARKASTTRAMKKENRSPVSASSHYHHPSYSSLHEDAFYQNYPSTAYPYEGDRSSIYYPEASTSQQLVASYLQDEASTSAFGASTSTPGDLFYAQANSDFFHHSGEPGRLDETQLFNFAPNYGGNDQ